MESTEAATQGNEVRVTVLLSAQRQHFFEDVVVVLSMTTEPGGRMLMVGVPTLSIDRIDTVDLNVASVDVVSHDINHAPIGAFEVATLGCGEDEDSRPSMPPDL